MNYMLLNTAVGLEGHLKDAHQFHVWDTGTSVKPRRDQIKHNGGGGGVWQSSTFYRDVGPGGVCPSRQRPKEALGNLSCPGHSGDKRIAVCEQRATLLRLFTLGARSPPVGTSGDNKGLPLVHKYPPMGFGSSQPQTSSGSAGSIKAQPQLNRYLGIRDSK